MKRFTVTEKWSDSWFSELTPLHKLGWLYILDNCDGAGVMEKPGSRATFETGVEDWEEFLVIAGDRIEVLDGGKWFIIKFIEIQYNGKVSPNAKFHNLVRGSLRKHGLNDRYSIPKECPIDTQSIPNEWSPSKGNGNGNKEGGSGGKGSSKSKYEAMTKELMKVWNEKTKGVLDAANKITDTRVKAVTRVHKEHGDLLEIWPKVLDNLIKSQHHIGMNERGWTAKFDFMFQSQNDRILQFSEVNEKPAQQSRNGHEDKPNPNATRWV